MNTYSEIFEEIIKIMREDSSTYKDWGAGSYRKYKNMIYDTMSRKEFVRIVKMYISEFRLPGHLQFTDDTMGNIDYAVIRYENTLYVTKASVNSRMKKGDRIVAVDSKSIEETAMENKVFLMDEPIERQTHLWWH